MKTKSSIQPHLKCCLTSISLFVTQILFSQAPEIEWQNTIGGDQSDVLHCVTQTSDGGYILAGFSGSGIYGDKTEPLIGGVLFSADFWVIKLNASGEIVWQNTIGGNGSEDVYSVAETSDGGYILGGWSNSGISGDKTEAAIGSNDYWVIKLNSTGGIEWQNTIGGSLDDRLYSIAQTSDGGYILGGTSTSGISGDKTESNMGLYTDYWVIKLNSAGSIVWQNTIGGNSQDVLVNVAQTADGGYIVGGYSYTKEISGDKTEANVGLVFSDYWILKLNSTGDIIWQNTIGGNKYDYLREITQTTDGGYILGGESLSDISGDKTEANLGLYDCWVIKLNATGVIEWQNTIGGSAGEGLNSIKQTSDGGYILGGSSSSGISGDKTEACFGESDYWILKLNSTGNIEWQNTIGGSDIDVTECISQTIDGGYIIGGPSYSGISGNKTEAHVGDLPSTWDYWVVKLEGPGCIPETEICNTLDDNCNGLVDDGVVETVSVSVGGPTTFCQGGNVILTAAYTGTSVQWKKDGANIPGATSSTYTVTKKATYTCTTTSACGSATSTGIYVNVIKNPAASITAGGPTTFCTGGSVTLTEAAQPGCSYQWYKGATAIAGATALNYIATATGNYKCRVTKTATGCYKNSNSIAVSVPCKEGELININSITLFPNPAGDEISVTINTDINIPISLLITDMSGKLIDQIEMNSQTIIVDISNYANGVYFVKCVAGSQILTRNFVKN